MLVQVLFPEGILQGFGDALIEPVWAKIWDAAKNMPKAQPAKNTVVFAIVRTPILPAPCLRLPHSPKLKRTAISISASKSDVVSAGQKAGSTAPPSPSTTASKPWTTS